MEMKGVKGERENDAFLACDAKWQMNHLLSLTIRSNDVADNSVTSPFCVTERFGEPQGVRRAGFLNKYPAP